MHFPTTDPLGLPWLLPAPDDLRAQVRALGGGTDAIAAHALTGLAGHALDLDQLTSVAKLLDKGRARIEPGTLTPLRLAVLMDGTADHLAPAIRASGLRHGLLIDTWVAPYGQALAEATRPGSDLGASGVQMALVASDFRSLGLGRPHVDAGAAEDAVAGALARMEAIVGGLAARKITPVLATVPVPAGGWMGSFDALAPGSPAAMVTEFNVRLAGLARDRGALLFDAARVAALVGHGRWFDDGLWNRSKIPFALDAVPLWADHVARLLGAARGKARKCLVLDLDNTLWGGIIGDDGLEGIKLGQGSSDGEAHLAVQAMALDLKARGVVLAVVSKNEDAAARLPFQKHPEMLLREADIAVFLANWNDKATNIAHVATTLNIGVDALLFLDDNPAERARVRQMLPQVAVPEVPADPSLYPMMVMGSGWFDAVALSDDDLKRAEQYRANAERSVALQQIGDYDDYLASLDMACELSAFDGIGRARIAQLINKSNQFNLTTRRYTEAEVAAAEAEPQVFDLQVRLVDRFGDTGMISVVIARASGEEWLIDTWLMSCRVLGRRVEEAVLASLVQGARAAGAKRLVGEWLPSPKNAMVERHYEKLGFKPAGMIDGGGTRWVLDLADHVQPKLPMALSGDRSFAA